MPRRNVSEREQRLNMGVVSWKFVRASGALIDSMQRLRECHADSSGVARAGGGAINEL